MKKGTKILAVLLTAAYSLSLTGCGETTVNSSSASSSSQTVAQGSSSDETVVYYTATFLNWDGTTLATVQVKKGEKASYTGAVPSKKGDAQYSYVFSGWDKALDNVEADTTFTAQFTQNVNNYTVVFMNYDGTVLDTETVAYGSVAEYKGATPTKKGDDEFTDYTFAGWNKSISNITGNLVVMATYTSQTRDFSLSLDGASYTVTGLNYEVETQITNLVIPASYKGIAITKIGEKAFYHEYDLVTVTLPSSITTIGKEAFRGCDGLTTLNMSDGIESIGENAFYDCSNLTTNDKDGLSYLGNQTNKYMVVIGHTSSTMTEVTLENTTRVIGPHAFEHCTSLATVNLPSGLVGIDDNAFQACASLKTLSLPSSVKHIGSKIFYMTPSAALTTAEDGAMYLGNAENKYFALVSDAFSNNATSVTVNSATKVLADYAFFGNSKLTSITLPSSITKISKELFSGCSGLADFVMPSGVTEIGYHAFYGCSSLTSIAIPKDITYIGKGAFSGCQSLDAIDIDKDNQYYSSVDGVLYSKDQKTILIYPAGKMADFTIPATVTSIADGAFYRANLTSLTILASMEQIDSYAFYECKMLTTVTISSNIDQLGESAFEGCIRLASVVLSDYIEKIGSNAFLDCYSLKSISLPAGLQVIGGDIFKNCDSLEYNEKDGLDYLGNANNKYLLLMKPVDATAITTAAIASGTTLLNYSCLANCTKLTSVSFPASTLLNGIPEDAFSGCTALDSFTVDAANKTMSAVDGCITDKKQKTLRIFPMGRTGTYTIPASIAMIYNAAFTNCPNLTGLVVPTTVTYIDYGAFEGCSGLTIYAQATAQPQTWNQGWNTNFSGKISYYSETQTTGCWHFVNNVPTAW